MNSALSWSLMSPLSWMSLMSDRSMLLIESRRTSSSRYGNVRRWLTGVAAVDVPVRIDVKASVLNQASVVGSSIAMSPPL